MSLPLESVMMLQDAVCDCPSVHQCSDSWRGRSQVEQLMLGKGKVVP